MVRQGNLIPGSRPSRLRLAELAIIASLILILVGMVVHKVWQTRIAAERVAVLQTIGALRAALGTTVAVRTARGGLATLAELHQSNPMDLVDETPAGYLGALDHPDPATVDGYHWYFDRQQRLLVYRVANAEHFQGGPPGPARIRLQLQAAYSDRNGNGRLDPQVDRVAGLRLVVLDEFEWRLP